VSCNIELQAEATKAPEINPFDIINDERQKENNLLINFSAAC
jgi:hypothetical protein